MLISISSLNLYFYVKLKFNFYTKIYCLIHFYVNLLSKRKKLKSQVSTRITLLLFLSFPFTKPNSYNFSWSIREEWFMIIFYSKLPLQIVFISLLANKWFSRIFSFYSFVIVILSFSMTLSILISRLCDLIQVKRLVLIKCIFNQWLMCRQRYRSRNMSISVAWISSYL